MCTIPGPQHTIHRLVLLCVFDLMTGGANKILSLWAVMMLEREHWASD
jgi:hypothetical protein